MCLFAPNNETFEPLYGQICGYPDMLITACCQWLFVCVLFPTEIFRCNSQLLASWRLNYCFLLRMANLLILIFMMVEERRKENVWKWWYRKNIRRRLERKWHSTRLLWDREQYIHQCYVVNNLIESLKSTYYTDIINEHSSDQRILFTTVGKLLQKSTNKRYPPSSDDTVLANSFADFFTSKIDKIHQGLFERKIHVGSSPPGPGCSNVG